MIRKSKPITDFVSLFSHRLHVSSVVGYELGW